jgi:hypothetical protein
MGNADVLLEASLRVTLVCGLLAAAALFLWLVRHRPGQPEASLRLPLMGLAIAVGATCVFLWMQYFGF